MTTSVKVDFIQGSVCKVTGTKICTLLLEYPRAIHSQLMTHRVFSRNSSSTRAVPISKSIEQIKKNPAKYIWTSNASGMQGPIIDDPMLFQHIEKKYRAFMKQTFSFVESLNASFGANGCNVHKQNAGRFLEPFQNIRVCLTSTEWENWDWLRVDVEAQPEIEALAIKMKEVRETGYYMPLYQGEYHVPFVNRVRNPNNEIDYFIENDLGGYENLTLEQAIAISQSCCAQTSYRVLDASLDKAEKIIEKLFNGRKVHASPTEHQATPIGATHIKLGFQNKDGKYRPYHEPENWPTGVTAIDRKSNYWSGNFKHWIQHRQLIPNHDPSKEPTCD